MNGSHKREDDITGRWLSLQGERTSKENARDVDVPVIIVGAGPVGLSLALGLAHHDVPSVVLERREQPSTESRALIVWPRTAEVLRDWGAWDALRAAGSFRRSVSPVNARDGASLLTLDFSSVDDVLDDAGALVIPQYETERVLRERVAMQPLCDLRTNCDVTGVAQDAQGVDITYTDAIGSTVQLRSGFAVGADGAHGFVRGSLGLNLAGTTYRARVILSDEVFDIPPSLSSPRIVIDRPGLLVGIEYAPGHWRIIASIPAEIKDEVAQSDEAHAQRLRLVFGQTDGAHTIWRNLFRIHRRHVAHFAVSRIALAGDAAHLNSPAGGQGMNAGIQDAANLAWKLAYAIKGRGDAARLVESYDLERREMISDTVERYTDRLTRMGIGLPAFAKKMGLRFFSRSIRGRGMQRKMCRSMGMLSGRYTTSPLIACTHPLAGRRIPDLILANGQRINAMRKGKAALLLVGKACSQSWIDDFAAICITNPPKRWLIKKGAAIIVRPDGCVAAVIEKPTPELIRAGWARAFAG